MNVPQPQIEDHSFGPDIRAARLARGWSLRTVANLAGGMAFTSVEDFEKGTHQPRLDKAIRIAKVLGLSIDKMAGLK